MISFSILKESDRFSCLSVNGQDEFTWCETSDFLGKDSMWYTTFSVITFRNGSIVRDVKKSIVEPVFYGIVGTIEGKRSGGYRLDHQQTDLLSWGKKEKSYRVRETNTRAISQGRKFVCFSDASKQKWLPDIMTAKAKRSAHKVFDHQGPAIVDLDTGEFKTLEFSSFIPREVRIHPTESMLALLGGNEVAIIDL